MELSFVIFFMLLELAKLDKTERRYAWIKRRIRTNEEIWKIFPSSWHVPYRLCIQFCKKTRYDLLVFHINPFCSDLHLFCGGQKWVDFLDGLIFMKIYVQLKTFKILV